MSQPAQATPVFIEGEASFTAPFGHHLDLQVGEDHVAAFMHIDGADARQPLVSAYGYGRARSARINGKPVLIIGHTYFPLPADAHAAAVNFLTYSGAYSRTEGVDA